MTVARHTRFHFLHIRPAALCWLFFWLAPAAFLSCNRHATPAEKPPPTGAAADTLTALDSLLLPTAEPRLLASLKRTPCYGRCPVYEIQFFSNGEVVFNGERNLRRLGIFLARVPESTLRQILEQAGQARFFELKDAYPESGAAITDLPETITFVNNGKARKTITNYYDAPLPLLRFEQFLDEIANGLDWQPKVE